MTTTLIRKANWSAVWDASLKTHRYARDSDIVFSDDRIVYVGPDYDGQWDHEIDGRSSFVMPGLINIHSHPQHEPAYRGIREEHGRPEMYDTGLYERLQAFSLDDARPLRNWPTGSYYCAESLRWQTCRRCRPGGLT